MAYRILKNAGFAPTDLPRGANKLSLLKLRSDNRYFSRVVRKLAR
jgi:hypothetical protein